jgi:hypothetical protein
MWIFQIKSCIEEVKGSTDKEGGEADEAQEYIKTTACILAKVRCRNSVSIYSSSHKTN